MRMEAGVKDPIVAGKYKISEAVRQLYDVLHNFNKFSGIADQSESAENMVEDALLGATPTPDGLLEEGGETLQLFNGNKYNPCNYDSDKYDYHGWQNLPALFLKMTIVNPYFGDLIKVCIISAEFNHGVPYKNKADWENDKKWVGVASVIFQALS